MKPPPWKYRMMGSFPGDGGVCGMKRRMEILAEVFNVMSLEKASMESVLLGSVEGARVGTMSYLVKEPLELILTLRNLYGSMVECWLEDDDDSPIVVEKF